MPRLASDCRGLAPPLARLCATSEMVVTYSRVLIIANVGYLQAFFWAEAQRALSPAGMPPSVSAGAGAAWLLKNRSFMTIPGVLITSSAYPVKETMDRIQTVIQDLGGTIYARIDQQKELHSVGLKLLPLEYLLFGNPEVGGLFMATNPVAALDLPLKIIAWEDGEQQVRVAFNEASYIRTRYSLPPTTAYLLELNVLVAKALAP